MIVDLERNNNFWGLNLKFPEVPIHLSTVKA